MKNLLITLFLLPASLMAQTLSSPDGSYLFRFSPSDKGPTYSITFHGDTLIRPSRLGVDVDNRLFESALGVPRGTNDDWSSDLVLKGEERAEHDSLWTPLYGENHTVRDHYNELILHLQKGNNEEGALSKGYDKRKFYAMDIQVRAYNEGIALRYHFPETSNGLFLHVTGEQTSYCVPEGSMAWHEEWAQGPYLKRPLTGAWTECERPLLLQLPNGTYMALLEAAQRDFPRGKFLLRQPHELQVHLYGDVDLISPYNTPWRIIMAGREAVDLINNKDLVLNLNDSPAPSSDWSWVRPGRAFRCTRLDRANLLRSIDFCADFGIEYVELDAGWYGPEGQLSSDARRVSPQRDFDLSEICAYARNKGVGVWIYVNQRALSRQLDDLLPIYQAWGISGIKFGFVQVGSAQWTSWLHEAVAKCAAHHLMVDIHDEYRPTGLSRTLPNLLTQEGIRGNEEMPDATHDVTLPFTRFLCGPADYTLCYFDKRVKNTRCHQLAMAAVYYSPLQFLFWYDLPYATGWDSGELHFWCHCPTVFDESRALAGNPGEYIVQARRADNEWFVGILNNTDARTITFDPSFLPAGRYSVTLYQDSPTTQSPKQVAITTQHIRVDSSRKGRVSAEPITLSLLPSGGAAMHIVPQKQ